MKLFNSFCIATTLVTFAATTDAAPRKVVGENFTATWCTYCPNVAYGLIMLQEEFPDSFLRCKFTEAMIIQLRGVTHVKTFIAFLDIRQFGLMASSL